MFFEKYNGSWGNFRVSFEKSVNFLMIPDFSGIIFWYQYSFWVCFLSVEISISQSNMFELSYQGNEFSLILRNEV